MWFRVRGLSIATSNSSVLFGGTGEPRLCLCVTSIMLSLFVLLLTSVRWILPIFLAALEQRLCRRGCTWQAPALCLLSSETSSAWMLRPCLLLWVCSMRWGVALQSQDEELLGRRGARRDCIQWHAAQVPLLGRLHAAPSATGSVVEYSNILKLRRQFKSPSACSKVKQAALEPDEVLVNSQLPMHKEHEV